MAGTEKQRSASTTSARVYHLKVSLEGIEPLIWRRLQVPGDASLGWLHAVIGAVSDIPPAIQLPEASATEGDVPAKLTLIWTRFGLASYCVLQVEHPKAA